MPSQKTSWNTYPSEVTILSFYKTSLHFSVTPRTSCDLSKHTASHPRAEPQSTVLPHCRDVQDAHGCAVTTACFCLPKGGWFFPHDSSQRKGKCRAGAKQPQPPHSSICSHAAQHSSPVSQPSALVVKLPRTFLKSVLLQLHFPQFIDQKKKS